MRTMVHFSDSGRPLPRAIVREGTWLRRKARSLLGAKLAAEIDSSDVAQELQLRALEQADRLHFANRQAFRGWLQRVLANFIAQHGRRLRTSQPVPENRAGGSRNGPSNLLRSEERRAGALRKLEHLSERQRRVVELRLWEDLPFAECGRRLDITENLARVTFHRALARLREVTGNEE